MPAKKAHDTARLKRAFLKEFGGCGNITLAAEVVGMTRRTHYRWLEDDPAYCESFRWATEEAVDRLEAEARRRAVEGVEEPTGWYQGQPGAYIRRYSDVLLIFLLKGAAPKKYRDRGASLANLDMSKLPEHVLKRIAAGEPHVDVLASAVIDAHRSPTAQPRNT